MKGVFVGLVVIALLLGGAYYFKDNISISGLPGFSLVPSGAQLVDQVSLSGSSVYTCPTQTPDGKNVDTCLVGGNINCDVPTGENVAYCGSDRGKSWATVDQCKNDGGYRSSIGCSSQKCQLVSTQKYTCTFGLCSSTSANYPNCEFTKTSDSPWSMFVAPDTDGIVLQSGQQATFQPRVPGGQSLAANKFTLSSWNYDLTCTLPPEQGGSCDATLLADGTTQDKYCKPDFSCPSGVFSSSALCGTLDGQKISATTLNNICRTNSLSSTGGGSYVCFTPNSNTGSYQSCVSQSNTCNSQGTTIKSCPTGQSCKPNNGQVGSEGWGSCVCENSNACGNLIVGQKQSVSATSYKICCNGGLTSGGECSSSSACPALSTTQSCPAGLYFNSNTQSCECPTKSQNPSRCESYEVGGSVCSTSTSAQVCVSKTVGSKTCYQWETSAVCLSGQSCSSGSCVCNNQPCSDVNQQSCSGDVLLNCELDTSSGCFNFVNAGAKQGCCVSDFDCNDNNPSTSDTCSTNNECINTEITDFCTVNSECSGELVCNPQSNRCEFPTSTDTFCTAAEANVGETRCSGRAIEICKSFADGSFRWEFLEQCQTFEACVKNSPAQCVIPHGVSIGFEDTYGVNEVIGGKIVVNNVVGSNSGLLVYGQLLINDVVITQTPNANTNILGEVSLEFPAQKKAGQATLKFFVSDGSTVSENSKTITISPSICLSLSSSIVAKTGAQTTVVASTTNCETGQILSNVNLEVMVTQNGDEIAANIVGGQITFIPTELGFVQIEATARLADYLDDSDTLTITVQEPQRRIDLFIGGKDITQIRNNEIDLGIQTIEIRTSLDGTTPLKFDQVSASMIEPSGNEVPLTLIESGEGVYRASFNFKEQGTNYQLKYSLIKFGESTQLDGEITLSTLGKLTTEQTIFTTGPVVVIIIIALVLVVLAIWIGIRVAKK